MERDDGPTLRADTRDLFDAALIAPLVVPFVFAVTGVVVLGPKGGSVIGGVISGFVFGMLLGLPIAYFMTVAVALPVVLLWRRVFGSIGLFSTLLLGAVLGLGPPVLIALPDVLRIGLARLLPQLPRLVGNLACLMFSLCGVTTAAAFWWVGLRNDAPCRDQ